MGKGESRGGAVLKYMHPKPYTSKIFAWFPTEGIVFREVKKKIKWCLKGDYTVVPVHPTKFLGSSCVRAPLEES